jgi:CheY-like chemotaxis protein
VPIKLMAASRRRPGLTRAEYFRCLEHYHGTAARQERFKINRYIQNHVIDGAFGILSDTSHKNRTSVREAVVELYFDCFQDMLDCPRSLTAELYPPILHQRGLVPALEWLVLWMQAKYGLIMNLICHKPIESSSQGITIFLFQATRELLFNVVKHAGVNTVSVEIRQQEDQIQIAVADQGVGFNPASLRAANATTGGLGLFSLIERLAHLGGRMEIDSSPGEGTRITLFAPLSSLPLKTAPLVAEKQTFVSAPNKRQTPSDNKEKRIRVVLVDDHKIVRQGLAALLREQPYLQVVGEASNGQSALDLIRQIRPDIVLMDIGLPDISGIEVTQILHNELPDVRIIGLSMFDEGEKAAAIRKAGAVDYVSKGEPSEAVIVAIRACVPVPEQMEKRFPDGDLNGRAPATTTLG